jgi:O-antigen/teichoic acid export membrane protein
MTNPARPPPSQAKNPGQGDSIPSVAASPFSLLIKNALWLVFDRGFRFVLVFLTSVAVTRHLGPSANGALNQALATAAILAGLCDLGLDTIIRLEVIKRPGEVDAILSTATILRLLAALVLFPIYIGILLISTTETLPLGVLCGVGLTVAWPIGLVFDSWFQAQTQARYSVWAQNIGLTIGTLLKLGGVMAGWSLTWFGWTAAFEMLLAGGLLAFAYRRQQRHSKPWKFDGRIATRLLAAAWPLAVTNLAILLYSKIDVILLAARVSQSEAGIYAAAIRISEMGYILPMVLVNTLFPLLAHLHGVDRARFDEVLRRLLAIVAWSGVLTAGLMCGLADRLIPLLYGPDFMAASTALTITAFNVIFAGLGAVRSQWLLLNGLQQYGLYYVGAGAILNVSLNSLLIPYWGGPGAALASVATQIFVVLVAPLFFPSTRPI